MSAKQGQEYRIVNPSPTAKRVGQPAPSVLRSTIEGVQVDDMIGDVIYASENVEYPRGSSKDYRHVRWINEHPNRFELLSND